MDNNRNKEEAEKNTIDLLLPVTTKSTTTTTNTTDNHHHVNYDDDAGNQTPLDKSCGSNNGHILLVKLAAARCHPQVADSDQNIRMMEKEEKGIDPPVPETVGNNNNNNNNQHDDTNREEDVPTSAAAQGIKTTLDNVDDESEQQQKDGKEEDKEVTATEGEKKAAKAPIVVEKKRKGRSVESSNKEVYSHFEDGEKRSGNSYCICRHCIQDYDEKRMLFDRGCSISKPKKPKAFRKRPGHCRDHLAKCEPYKRHKEAGTTGATGSQDMPQQQGLAVADDEESNNNNNAFSTEITAFQPQTTKRSLPSRLNRLEEVFGAPTVVDRIALLEKNCGFNGVGMKLESRITRLEELLD